MCLQPWDPLGSDQTGSSGVIGGGGVISSSARMVRCESVGRVVCWTVPAGPSRVTRWRHCSSVAIRRQLSGGAVGDSDQQQGEPADDDVGPDAVPESVEEGAARAWSSGRGRSAQHRAGSCSRAQSPRALRSGSETAGRRAAHATPPEPQPTPQRIQQPCAPERPRADHLQPLGRLDRRPAHLRARDRCSGGSKTRQPPQPHQLRHSGGSEGSGSGRRNRCEPRGPQMESLV